MNHLIPGRDSSFWTKLLLVIVHLLGIIEVNAPGGPACEKGIYRCSFKESESENILDKIQVQLIAEPNKDFIPEDYVFVEYEDGVSKDPLVQPGTHSSMWEHVNYCICPMSFADYFPKMA